MVSIDRIENGIAVCIRDEDEAELHLRAEQLPAGARPGDCMTLENGVWRIEAEETARRREANRLRLERLLNRSRNQPE